MIWPFTKWRREIEIATLDILSDGQELPSMTLWMRVEARVTAVRFGYTPHHVFRSLEAQGLLASREGRILENDRVRIFYRLAGA